MVPVLRVLVLLPALLHAYAITPPASAQRGHDAPNICARNETIGQAVINAVNLSWPGLEAVQSAAASGKLGAACEALAKYYANGNTATWLRMASTPAPSTRAAGGQADAAVDHDIWTLGGVGQTAKIPRNDDGGIDWYDKGPKSDPEFMNCVNRHTLFGTLLDAWNSTGNPKYPKYFSDLVEDWVEHLPCRNGVSRAGWNASGGALPCATGTMESPWRVLEAGIRTQQTWPPAFFGFQRAGEFSTSARVLMVLGFSEHNAVINGPGRSAHTPNWAIAQWSGLVTSCVALPELRNCSELIDAAFEQLEYWMDNQVGWLLSRPTLWLEKNAPDIACFIAVGVPRWHRNRRSLRLRWMDGVRVLTDDHVVKAGRSLATTAILCRQGRDHVELSRQCRRSVWLLSTGRRHGSGAQWMESSGN